MEFPEEFYIVVGPEYRQGDPCHKVWPKVIVFESYPMTADQAMERARELAKTRGWASYFKVDTTEKGQQ